MNVLNGGRLEISDKYSFDVPEIHSKTAWDVLVSDFLSHAETFSIKVEQLPDPILDQPIQDESYGS